MKVLATAHPNKSYEHHSNYRGVSIQAILTDGGRVQYQEMQPGKMFSLTEETVLSLFPDEGLIHDRPFLVKENRDFYAVLHRNQVKYKERYEQLKQRLNDPPNSITRGKPRQSAGN